MLFCWWLYFLLSHAVLAPLSPDFSGRPNVSDLYGGPFFPPGSRCLSPPLALWTLNSGLICVFIFHEEFPVLADRLSRVARVSYPFDTS